MRFIKLIILVLFIAFIVIFFMQNTETISQPMKLHLNLYIASWSLIAMPYYFFLLAAFILGALLAGLFFIIEKIQHYSEIRGYKHKIFALQKEVRSLRAAPLQPNYPMIESGSADAAAKTEADSEYSKPIAMPEKTNSAYALTDEVETLDDGQQKDSKSKDNEV